ncbi:hypothetical protein B9Z55_011976 [Caenorhabditis nigoni]|uniref:Uncharacterized protein n=2 Tax=Caenorhabditis nigoni TaxID=1611254 RepID=A0A2G5TV69_9PELO|nr:hypothetical protein B9Z55_011976 [Caenorhabditis nigoni]
MSSNPDFLRRMHKQIFGDDINSATSNSQFSKPSSPIGSKFNSVASSSKPDTEKGTEWWAWLILAVIVLAVICSSIASSVGGFYAIQSKQKNQMGNQGTSGGAAQSGSRNNQGASGSKSNEKSNGSGSKEANKEA